MTDLIHTINFMAYCWCVRYKTRATSAVKSCAETEMGHTMDSCVELLTGFDGANPSRQEDVVMETPTRFRIKTFNEPGSNDHYWFWFNILVLNHGTKSVDVELLVEWPALERFPDHPYDYCFYGDYGDWHSVRATIVGTEARLIVPVKPGKTFVGFYPRYSYGRYEQFVASLSKHDSAIEKQTEGITDLGREIWSFRLTDPSVPDEPKPSFLITARGHPYETSCSYIVEEALKFLTSGDDDASTILSRNVIHFLPITNPDGVVLGLNQRTGLDGINISYGADSDAPEAKALRGLVEKCKPDLWIDIHSWPHQGDDGMWCTHQWVADGLLGEIPDRTWQDYVWNVSFLKDRNTPENHLWQWLVRTQGSGGVSLSFSWYRRTEEDVRAIGPDLIRAVDQMMQKRKPSEG